MELSFGQKIDPDNGLVMPWVVDGVKEWLKNKDLSDKIIWQFGCGLGDSWLAKKCKFLYCVERNQEWLDKSQTMAAANGITNIEYIFRPCNDSSGSADYYTEITKDVDIIFSDDAYRTEVCQVATDYLKAKGGGILICDNWIQSFVWISPKAEEIMAPYKSEVFEQADHMDNDGVNKWKTAIFYIP